MGGGDTCEPPNAEFAACNEQPCECDIECGENESCTVEPVCLYDRENLVDNEDGTCPTEMSEAESCVCAAGYTRDADGNCILTEDCPSDCVDENGEVIPAGTTFTKDGEPCTTYECKLGKITVIETMEEYQQRECVPLF